jgi:hypothetical protein
MDSKSLERFNFILNKSVDALTQDEISFLRARSGALNPIQTQFYAPILNPKEEVKTEENKEINKPKRNIKKVTNSSNA